MGKEKGIILQFEGPTNAITIFREKLSNYTSKAETKSQKGPVAPWVKAAVAFLGRGGARGLPLALKTNQGIGQWAWGHTWPAENWISETTDTN